jgi:predicted nucleic acid-binding protein
MPNRAGDRAGMASSQAPGCPGPAARPKDAAWPSYGRLAARVVAIGRHPRGRVMDLLIAATAHAHDATLYTRSVDDPKGLEDLIDIVAV